MSTVAHDIAHKFIHKHKSTFKTADQKQIKAAVDKVARALKDMHIASKRAERSAQRSSSSIVQM
jgi:hypothetical protein